jgi:hypothetical protein
MAQGPALVNKEWTLGCFESQHSPCSSEHVALLMDELMVSPLCLLNCSWPSPAHLFLVPSPTGLMTIFYCLAALGSLQTAYPSKDWIFCWTIHKFNSYLTENTSHLRYEAHPVHAVYENSRCLLELEFVLRPMDSRPLRLGIGPPFGAHSFSFFRLTVTLVLFLGRPPWREDGYVVYSAIAGWSGHWGPITTLYNLIWDYVPFLPPLTTHRDYGGSILTRLHTESCLLWGTYGTYRYSSYLTGDTLYIRYRTQPVNAVYGNSRCLLWTHRYTVWAECRVLVCQRRWYI